MDEFPPPPRRSDADRATRLAALAARRPLIGPSRTSDPSETDAVATRLASLTARRDAPSARRPGSDPRATGNRARPRHPAQGARLAALGLSLISTGGLATLFALNNSGTGNEVQAATFVTPSVVATTPSTTAASVATSPATTTAPTSTDVAVNATTTVVDGAVFRNKWGNVQVEATFGADGSLIDVTTLQTPDDRSKSIAINNDAVPRLNSEALTAQNASVHTVSGATYTSDDYQRSLQSAIDAARSAGVTAIA